MGPSSSLFRSVFYLCKGRPNRSLAWEMGRPYAHTKPEPQLPLYFLTRHLGLSVFAYTTHHTPHHIHLPFAQLSGARWGAENDKENSKYVRSLRPARFPFYERRKKNNSFLRYSQPRSLSPPYRICRLMLDILDGIRKDQNIELTEYKKHPIKPKRRAFPSALSRSAGFFFIIFFSVMANRGSVAEQCGR